MRTRFFQTLILLLLASALSAQVTKVDPLKLVKPSSTVSRFYGTNSSGATAWVQLSDLVTAGSNVTVSGNTIGLTGVVTGSGASGQVAYWNTATALTGSSNLFFTGTNLGVGTNTPGAKLHTSGSGEQYWRLESLSNGYSGLLFKNGTGTENRLYFNNNSDGGNGTFVFTTGGGGGGLRKKVAIGGGLSIGTGYINTDISVDNSLIVQGNVGFGTTSPEATLHVAGLSPLIVDVNQYASNIFFRSTNTGTNRGFGILFRDCDPSAPNGAVTRNLYYKNGTFIFGGNGSGFGPLSGARLMHLNGNMTIGTGASYVADTYNGNPNGLIVEGDVSIGTLANSAKVIIQGNTSIAGTYSLIVTNSGGSTTSPALAIQNTNTVGFGNNDPTAAVDISTTLRIRSFSTANNLLSVSDANGNITSVTPATVVTNGLGWRQGGNTFGAIGVAGTNDAFSMSLIAGGKEFLLGTTGGNVSIGSNASPSQRVSIYGPPSTAGTPFQDALVSVSGTWHNGTSSVNRTVEFGVDMLAATPTSEWVMRWTGGNPFLKALYTNQLQLPDYTSATAYTGTPVANLSVTSTGNVITTASVDGRFAVDREIAAYSTTVPSATGVNNTGWWVVPASLNGYKITGVDYSVATAGSGSGSYALQINRLTTGGTSSNFASATFVAADKNKSVTGLSFTLATGDLIRVNIGTADLATLPQGLTINYTIAP